MTSIVDIGTGEDPPLPPEDTSHHTNAGLKLNGAMPVLKLGFVEKRHASIVD